MDSRLEIREALLEHSREGMALVGADGVILYTNPALAQVLGFAANGHVGTQLVTLIHPEDQHSVRDLFAELLRPTADNARGVIRWLCGDGSWLELQATWTNQLAVPGVEAVVIHFGEIAPLGMPMQPFDLSGSRLFQVLVENAVHITAILEREGSIRYVSPAA